MSTDTVTEDFFNHLFGAAESVVRTGVEHPIILAAITADGQLMAGELTEGSTKDDYAIAQRNLSQSGHFVAVALIMEAWVLNLKSEAVDPDEIEQIQRGEMRVSDHPLRQEAIIFSIMTPTRQAFSQCLIDRMSNTLEKQPLYWINEGEAVVSGRFVRENPTIN